MTQNPKLTEPQHRVLVALQERGGEGVVDSHGFVVARGERIRTDEGTWLRLFTLKMIQSAGPMRLALTFDGQQAALNDFRPYKGPVTDYRSGLVPAIPGAE